VTANQHAQVDDEPAPDAQFEAFWVAHGARGPERCTVLGVEITIPSDLPLDVERRAGALEDSDDPEAVRELLAMVFGDGVLDAWTDRGLTIRQFQFLLAWAFARGDGRRVTFEEFWPEFEQLEQQGKAPTNRAERRAKKKTKGRR
jgi:hypothetical protein